MDVQDGKRRARILADTRKRALAESKLMHSGLKLKETFDQDGFILVSL